MKRLNLVMSLTLALLSGSTMISCVNSDYDLNKDVDLTMGLGSDGLKVKLGQTEKMYLRDLLKVEDSELLDTTETKEYFLIKDGTSTFNVEVEPINSMTMNPTVVKTDPIFTNDTEYDIPSDISSLPESVQSQIKLEKYIEGNQVSKFSIMDINDDVAEIAKIEFEGEKYINIKYSLSNNKFQLTGIKEAKINFPNNVFIYNEIGEVGHVYTLNRIPENNVLNIRLANIQLEKYNGGKYGHKIDNSRNIELTEKVSITGTFKAKIKDGQTIRKGEDVKVINEVTFPTILPKQVSGIMDPKISPDIDPINISNDLPDFLQDETVELHVSNPTIRFDVEGRNIPIPLDFTADINSVKDNDLISTVKAPSNGIVGIRKNTDFTFYLYQGNLWDPNKKENADKYIVNNLDELVTRIPDEIKVDVSEGHIVANQNEEHHITVNTSYKATLDYQLIVPLSFNANTQIVYSDSCDSMNDDLKDYQADGATVTGTGVNTIPLDLNVAITPQDIAGNKINEIEIEEAIIKAGKKDEPATTPITINLKTKNPSDISKLDKLIIKIYCKAEVPGQLYSDQYVEIKDIRIRLNGKIITNFN